MKRGRAAAAVIVAAGAGRRMGGPKQFLPLAGRPLLDWSVRTFLEIDVARVAVVLTPDDAARHSRDWKDRRVKVVTGGATRLESVRRGVAAAGAARLIAVHDGARPLVDAALIRACLSAAERSGAAVPAVPVKDTLKEAAPGSSVVAGTPDRARFWAAQTPQCYRADVLKRALASGARDATDESQLVEALGVPVALVPSSYENLKVTTPEDLAVAEALLRRRAGAGARVRTGLGYDVHRLAAGRPLWLAGLRLEHPKGLLGHSDADVVLHAVSDALLGAAGAGEIGELFPPGDPRTKGIASRRILERVLAVLAARGARIENVDVVVIAEEPKLRVHYAALRASLAALLGLPAGAVSLKAKTQEGLGEIGRGEAIACQAVATLLL